jgi:hypothetical protein
MTMYAMVDMAQAAEDNDDGPSAAVDAPTRPRYPYGLRISLTHEELEKMGIETADAFVGGICHLHARGKITSISNNEVENQEGEAKQDCRIEIQIVALSIESEDEENEMVEADPIMGMRRIYKTMMGQS